MYADGLLDEARTLMGLELSSTARQAIGYAEAFAVLKNEMTLDDAREKTVIRTRQLAKRQMTWFRNQLKVEWINTADYPDVGALASAVSNAWEKTGPAAVRI
jgi:tRNA dimethylallyltransferase